MKIVFDPSCLTYQQSGHPESPRRVKLAYDYLQSKGETIAPEPATETDILTVHSPYHLETVRNGWYMDIDTPALPFMFDHALKSVGGALTAMRLALDGQQAISLMRPPGHHAGRDYLGGFCYFNNVAIATARALEQVGKVAIIDFDCHHGNGTEDIFRGDERVVYLSLHQSPFYPGTGLRSDGNIINYPLGDGTDDTSWLAALDDGLTKIRAWGPDLIAASAGFDSYEKDRFSFHMLRLETFERVGEKIAALGRPVFSVLEGGYSDEVGRCVEVYMRGLATR